MGIAERISVAVRESHALFKLDARRVEVEEREGEISRDTERETDRERGGGGGEREREKSERVRIDRTEQYDVPSRDNDISQLAI